MQYIYLDNNATTPCDDSVLRAILPFFRERFGNPASPHGMGKEASAAISDARDSVAYQLRCTSSEIVFTSGATESNNLLLTGFTPQNARRRRIVTSQIEHKSVRMPCRKRQTQGFDLQEISVTADGVVDLSVAAELIDDTTALVSVQAANNETGVLQPIHALADMAHSKGALFHCDAAQWVGKLPTPEWFDRCDFLSISGHKFYGPKGAGALMVRCGGPRQCVAPVILGGGQENGLRAGTCNVPSIVGMGVACSIVGERVDNDRRNVEMMRNSFERAIRTALPIARINGATASRLPGSCSLTIPDIPASMLIANLHPICVGEGSACTSGAVEPSHVLVAMGLTREDADCTIRISFGRMNTLQDAADAARSIEDVVRYLRDDACMNRK
jgi:cysteine desulfurase